jgi:hypothetical protein
MAASVPRIMASTKVVDSHLTRDEKLMELLETYYPVSLIDEGNYSERLTWCLEHCQNKFRDIKLSKSRVWYFQNEEDATLFAMKWA